MVTPAKPAVNGAVYYGPLTATLPTSASAALTGFTSLGYVSEDGVIRAIDLESNTVREWGGKVVLALETGRTETFQFVLLEANNTDVLKLKHGDNNVTGSISTGITVQSNSGDLSGHAFVIDMIEAENTLHRIVIPNGVVTAIGDTAYVRNAAVTHDLTITAIADSSGNTAYDYIKTASVT